MEAVGTFKLPFCCSSPEPSELDSSLALLACSAAAAASSAAALSSASACSVIGHTSSAHHPDFTSLYFRA